MLLLLDFKGIRQRSRVPKTGTMGQEKKGNKMVKTVWLLIKACSKTLAGLICLGLEKPSAHGFGKRKVAHHTRRGDEDGTDRKGRGERWEEETKTCLALV